MVVALCASALVSAPAEAAKGSCGRAAGCTKFELIHAGSTYGWYPAGKRFEFKTAQGATPPARWKLTGRPNSWVSGKPGYGTLMTRNDLDRGDVITDWRWAKKNGRWEVRFRSLSKRDPAQRTIEIKRPDGSRVAEPITDAALRLELVPAGTRAQRCSPTSVLLAGYSPSDQRTATLGVRAPDASYAGTVTAWSQLADQSWRRQWKGGNSKKSAWHVWAVELRPTVITWFLDGKVVRRAPRPASTQNLKFSFRQGTLSSLTPGVHTAFTSTQMDWARYYSLKKLTKKKAKKRALAHAPVLARTSGSTIGPC